MMIRTPVVAQIALLFVSKGHAQVARGAYIFLFSPALTAISAH